VLLADSRVKQEINATNSWGETALILAATRGDSVAVSLLLNEGADATLRDNWGKSAAEVADDHGEHATAEVLKNYTPGKTVAIPTAVKPPVAKSVAAIKRVLSKLLEAPLDEEQALKWIAEEGMDINGADYLKWTALCCFFLLS